MGDLVSVEDDVKNLATCRACNTTPYDGAGVIIVAGSVQHGAKRGRSAWICEDCTNGALDNRGHAAAVGNLVLWLAGRMSAEGDHATV